MSEHINQMKRIDDIIHKTIEIIEKGQKDIFDIAEYGREELESIEKELKILKERTVQVIEEVDRLRKEEKTARYRLLVVSKNFHKYSEEDIRESYKKAEDLKVMFSLKEEEEKRIREERDKLELRLKSARKLMNKADSMVSHIGVTLDYLRVGAQGIDALAENVRKKQYIGYRVIKASEEERCRLAREIHDGPTQAMVNISINLELCLKVLDKDIDKAKTYIMELKEQVNQNIRDLRKVIYNLRPMSLDDLGLIATIEKYLKDFEASTGILTSFRVIGEPVEIKGLVQVALYRIIQESLSNVKKHSGAGRVIVKIEFIEGHISLLIIDDGKGFDVEKAFKWENNEHGFGLINMRERVELLRGYTEIKSDMGKGSSIFLKIPLD